MGEMNEYIEKTAALDICQKEYEERLRMADYCGDTVAWNIGGAIKNLPAADVFPVRHGRWEMAPYNGVYDIRCSSCGYCPGIRFYISDYCPNCGARMDKEDDTPTSFDDKLYGETDRVIGDDSPETWLDLDVPGEVPHD